MHKNLDIGEYFTDESGNRQAHVTCVDCKAQGVILLEDMTVEPPIIEAVEV